MKQTGNAEAFQNKVFWKCLWVNNQGLVLKYSFMFIGIENLFVEFHVETTDLWEEKDQNIRGWKFLREAVVKPSDLAGVSVNSPLKKAVFPEWERLNWSYSIKHSFNSRPESLLSHFKKRNPFRKNSNS